MKKYTNESIIAVNFKECLYVVFITIAIIVLIRTFLFNTTYVLGDSMNPTLYEKDMLVSLKIPLYLSGPKHGDVVVLEAPDDKSKDYIKRIIGVENDRIEIHEGVVYLNGELLKEDYLDDNAYTETYSQNEWIVGKGEVFLLGDNRSEGASKDSRYFGCIDQKSLKGVTEFRFFPLNHRFGKIN